MKKKTLSLLSILLFSNLWVNSIVLPKSVHAETNQTTITPNINEYDDYTEEYGLSKNNEINPLVDNELDNIYESINNAPSSTKDIKYLAILVEFPDDDMKDIHLDDTNALRAGEMIARTGGKIISSDGETNIISVKDYFSLYSYNKLNVDVQYFPRNQNNKVISYVSKKSRNYYLPKTDSNLQGFTSENRVQRELELFNEVLAAIKPVIEKTYTSKQLDTNSDGYVDAINFFVESEYLDKKVKRGDILWSHKIDAMLSSQINNLAVGKYNVINAGDPKKPGSVFSYDTNSTSSNFKLNRSTYSVIIHEFLHTLGLYDLYREASGDPVGIYDIMGYNHPTNPQPVLTINSREILKWGQPIPELKMNETVKIYKPTYYGDDEKTSYKILSKLNSNEYFIVEYYDKPEGIANSGREDGIIIYRVRDDVYNNLQGSINHPEKDFIYIFRPNESRNGEANSDNLKNAVLSKVGATYGKTLEETGDSWNKDSIYFSDGKNSGIKLQIVNVTSDYISVKYIGPEVTGNGTASNPYLISNVSEWNNYVNSNNYVKLTQNIDFKGSKVITEDLINANIDGNEKKLSNITINNGSGLFESLTNCVVKNLTIENITVTGQSGGHAGALAGSLNSGVIDNVKILSGKVTGGNPSSYTIQGVGGFVGTIANGIIKNSHANVNVSKGQNIGAFIGLSQGGTIQDNSASGLVTFTSSEKAGGFYGSSLKLQGMAEKDATYTNNLFEVTNTNLKKANYTSYKDGIYGIFVPSKVSINLSESDIEALTATLYSSNSIQLSFTDFKIDNTSIVTLSDSKFKGLRVGTTKFYGKLKLGNAVLEFNRPIEVSGSNSPSNNSTSNNSRSTTLAKITRLGGLNRYETAALINNKMKSTTLILVTGKDFADALSSTALIKYHNAEIHLVNSTLDNNTLTSLNNGEFTKAIIVGGTGVVSSEVEAKVKNILGNNNVQRLGGKNRYETSYLVAASISKLISSGSEKYPYAFAVTGKNFADALSVAPIAAITGSPIVLTEGDNITQVGASALLSATKGFYKIGGGTIVGNGIDKLVGNNYKRLAGADRYATNRLVINEFKSLFTGDNVYLSTGLDFPDSLAGSALAGKNNSPIVFVTKTADEPTKHLIDTLNKANLTALGGEGVVSTSVINELNR